MEKHLRDVFIRYGRPDQLDSDGGPQFQSDGFSKFLTTWGIKHRTSSPYYPQSNGRAELGVKTAKRLLKGNANPDGTLNNDNVARAILQYHNTPLRDGPMSPAQLLFGRVLADFLPVNPNAYQLHPHWTKEVNKQQTQRAALHKRAAKRYNFGTRLLKPLTVGQHVLVQHHATKRWNRPAVVMEALPHRKFRIQMSDTGNMSYRNRRHLKPTFPLSGPNIAQTHHPNCTPTTVQHSDTDCNQTETTPHMPSEGGGEDELSQDIEQPQGQIAPARLKLAVRRLKPHNKPGLKE